jgi:hypothetical protein
MLRQNTRLILEPPPDLHELGLHLMSVDRGCQLTGHDVLAEMT